MQHIIELYALLANSRKPPHLVISIRQQNATQVWVLRGARWQGRRHTCALVAASSRNNTRPARLFVVLAKTKTADAWRPATTSTTNSWTLADRATNERQVCVCVCVGVEKNEVIIIIQKVCGAKSSLKHESVFARLLCSIFAAWQLQSFD